VVVGNVVAGPDVRRVMGLGTRIAVVAMNPVGLIRPFPFPSPLCESMVALPLPRLIIESIRSATGVSRFYKDRIWSPCQAMDMMEQTYVDANARTGVYVKLEKR